MLGETLKDFALSAHRPAHGFIDGRDTSHTHELAARYLVEQTMQFSNAGTSTHYLSCIAHCFAQI